MAKKRFVLKENVLLSHEMVTILFVLSSNDVTDTQLVVLSFLFSKKKKQIQKFRTPPCVEKEKKMHS